MKRERTFSLLFVLLLLLLLPEPVVRFARSVSGELTVIDGPGGPPGGPLAWSHVWVALLGWGGGDGCWVVGFVAGAGGGKAAKRV